MEQNNEISKMEMEVKKLLAKHKKDEEYKKSSSKEQSKEFTDALEFVLNYRENMEGMDGFIPSSDLAEMVMIYSQSKRKVDTLDNKKNIHEMLSEYDILLGMEENTFSWNIDILSEMFLVCKLDNLPSAQPKEGEQG